MFKIKKSDFLYIIIIIMLVLFTAISIKPSIENSINSNQRTNNIILYLDSIKSKESELNNVADGYLIDYFASINYYEEGKSLYVESKSLPSLLKKTTENIADDIKGINHELYSDAYQNAYDEIFWSEFYKVYETEPIVKNFVNVTFKDDKIDLTNGNNTSLISALLGFTSETQYQSFLSDIRESEDLAIELGRMTEAERTPGIYY